ncbi:MAG: hypothetical protein J3K34DRAFT_195146 [Monoraphidium minutum]|nr:MAG: hypothetical protein J3K34DRAFT_195146 [Monoraphidium minutum]
MRVAGSVGGEEGGGGVLARAARPAAALGAGGQARCGAVSRGSCAARVGAGCGGSALCPAVQSARQPAPGVRWRRRGGSGGRARRQRPARTRTQRCIRCKFNSLTRPHAGSGPPRARGPAVIWAGPASPPGLPGWGRPRGRLLSHMSSSSVTSPPVTCAATSLRSARRSGCRASWAPPAPCATPASTSRHTRRSRSRAGA